MPDALFPTLSSSGNESHAGQVFTCLGALSLAGALHLVDQDLFCWWLCERQTRSGGLNGRPEKLQDVSLKSGEAVFSEADLSALRPLVVRHGPDECRACLPHPPPVLSCQCVHSWTT